MAKQILVTGGNGMLGSYFKKESNCLCLSKKKLDITRLYQVEEVIKKHPIKTIIHLAALTDVDLAERCPEKAFSINTIGTFNLATLAKKYQLHLIYVSTAAVFSGKTKKAYQVNSVPNPANTYAQSKRLAEIMVQKICSQATIVRTGWLFGGLNKDKKFISYLLKQIQAGQNKLQAVADTYGCPTYCQDLAKVIMTITRQKKTGLYHVVNHGTASRYQIAKELVKICKLEKFIHVKKVSNRDFSLAAPRPKYEIIKANIPLRSWKIALKDYLKHWQEIWQTDLKEITETILLKVSTKDLNHYSYYQNQQKSIAQKY